MRNKNIINSCWNLTDIFLYPSLFFISASFFIRHLGQSQFGIWMLVNTIVVSMQLFNFGIGSAVLKNIALHAGTKNNEGKTDVLNNALSITAALFVLCLLLGGAGFYLVSRRQLFNVADDYRLLCAKCFILAGFIVGIKFFEQVFTNYFKAVENYRSAALLGSGSRLVSLGLNVLALFFFPLSILSLLCILAFINSLFIVLGFFLIKKDLEGYRFIFSLNIPKTEASFALFTWLQSLAIILTFQTDRYLVVSRFGLATLSYYALTATMFNQLHMGFSAIVPWLSPKFTKLYAQQKNSKRLYLAARNIVTASSLLLLIFIYLVYPTLFNAVLGAQTADKIKDYTRYFIIFESFFVLSIVPGYYFNAVGHERLYLYYVFFFCALSLTGMFVSVHIFHTAVSVLYGLIAACAVSMFVMRMILSKILSGIYETGSCIVQILPSIMVALCIVSKNPGVKSLSICIAIVTLYFTNIHGHKAKFLMLVNS